jgi:hypothetical protein
VNDLIVAELARPTVQAVRQPMGARLEIMRGRSKSSVFGEAFSEGGLPMVRPDWMRCR